MHASERQTRIRPVVLAAIMGATLAFAPHARAEPVNAGSSKATCPEGQATVVETKTCPARPGRPEFTLARACCTKITQKNPEGKTRCKSFPSCPSNSPS